MANEADDVIELGSSDEEAAPAPKKLKPMPNAMVHIPTKINNVLIKPVKSRGLPKLGKGVSVTKVSNPIFITNSSTPIHKKRLNTSILKSPIHTSDVHQKRILQTPVPVASGTAINPLSLMSKLKSQVMINKVPCPPQWLRNPIAVKSPKSINLPPSITVTKTYVGTKGNLAMIKQHNVGKKRTINKVVPTVELEDDDESTTPVTAGPQWYLRPEEQTEAAKLEEDQNREPEPSLVEITIEDSPAKSAPHNRTCEIGTELAITIDDSPIKVVTNNAKSTLSSDEEQNVKNKVVHSKKKLEYPKPEESEAEANARKTIEIEIEPIIIQDLTDKDCSEICVNDNKTEEKSKEQNLTYQIKNKGSALENSKSTITKEPEKVPSTIIIESAEFHPTYLSFINLCLQLENSEDMKKIVDKKIKGYYRQVPTEYTESEEFIDMVSSKIISMKAKPDRMYLYIKDVVDELNLQRKMVKSQPVPTQKNDTESQKFLYGKESAFDSKKQRQIRKLEKTLKKLHRAIKKLEEQEVDFDDEEDSVYLLTESDDGSSTGNEIDKELDRNRNELIKRYKERMVRVHAKFCQLTNTKMPSEPRIHIEVLPGKPAGPAKRLEKWVNKKVPIGAPLPFPDFHDVLRCVGEANKEDKLGWNEATIKEEAQDLFIRCGKKLQRRRQENEWRLAVSRITVDMEPSEEDAELMKKLEENKKKAANRETEVLNKFVDRQNQLKLEAEEIGDKEAEESSIEEDDEDDEESSSLENKEKRKNRLRKLIQEKNIKANKENQDEYSNEAQVIKGNVNDASKMIEGGTKVGISTTKITAVDVDACKDDKNNKDIEIHSLSDEKNASDVDELNLLKKLYSECEINSSSTLASSQSDIIISDTVESDAERANREKSPGDIISIENSSYSESETVNTVNDLEESDKKRNYDIMESEQENNRLCVSNKDKQNEKKTQKYDEDIENILLASSEDEDGGNKIESRDDNACFNLNDDSLSIGDTVIVGAVHAKDAKENIHDTNKMLSKKTGSHNLKDKVNNENVLSIEKKTFITKENTSTDCIDVTTTEINKTYTSDEGTKAFAAEEKDYGNANSDLNDTDVIMTEIRDTNDKDESHNADVTMSEGVDDVRSETNKSNESNMDKENSSALKKKYGTEEVLNDPKGSNTDIIMLNDNSHNSVDKAAEDNEILKDNDERNNVDTNTSVEAVISVPKAITSDVIMSEDPENNCTLNEKDNVNASKEENNTNCVKLSC